MTNTIFSPYRICPIGAHIDHQGGQVLGRTINLGTHLEFEPLPSCEIELESQQFGVYKFNIGAAIDPQHWARYAQAASRVLPDIKIGMRARVSGSLIGAGLSSSASVGLAYIKALADVNKMALTQSELVWLDFELERTQLGLQNGILDPLTIVYGRHDALLFMDTVVGGATPVYDTHIKNAAWIIAFSGVSRELTRSGFNVRVLECHQAAEMLQKGATKLGDISPQFFEENKSSLPDHLCRRANHFFGEVERVHLGRSAWEKGDLEQFGRLMNLSCGSSIRNYESGSEILIQLHELASSAKGVYGSRFSGGGYGGCVVALADAEQAPAAAAEIAEKFKALHPELPSNVFIAELGDGLR